MTELSAHALARTRFCKEDSCEQEVRRPVIERGPYSGLCDEHYEAMRKRMSLSGRNGRARQLDAPATQVSAPVAARPSANGEAPDLVHAVRALLAPASEVQKLAKRQRTAKAALRSAKRELQAGIEQFRAALAAVDGD